MKQPKKEKPTSQPNKRAFLVLSGALVVIVALAFLFRGWLRMTVIPKTISAAYGSSTKEVLEQEAAKLQDPISLLGFVPAGPQMGVCATSFAKGPSTQVVCSHTVMVYREINQDPQSKIDLAANAEKLQNLLSENGWEGEYTEDGIHTSLKKLIASISNGIDYQPDAAYRKQIGNTHCFFQSYTAFSSPAPPAFATQLSCSHTFNVLGKPSYGS